MSETVIFFGPFGWKKSVWQKLGVQQAAFIEFPFKDKKVEDIEQELTSMVNGYDEVIVVAASYGVPYFLYLLKQLTVRIKKIILIEGLHQPMSAEEITEIVEHRQVHFQNETDFLRDCLSEEELADGALRDIVLDTYNRQTKEHYVSNETLANYFAFMNNEAQQRKVLDNLNSIDVPITLYTSESAQQFHNPRLKVVDITEDDHLLMLTQPELLQADLAQRDEG